MLGYVFCSIRIYSFASFAFMAYYDTNESIVEICLRSELSIIEAYTYVCISKHDVCKQKICSLAYIWKKRWFQLKV